MAHTKSSRIQSAGMARSLLLLLAALPIAGCTMGPIALSGAPANTGTSSLGIKGGVHGGNQAIIGATLQLYAAGTPAMPSSGPSTGGYGSGATALIPTGSLAASATSAYYPGGAPNCPINSDATNPNSCTTLPQTDSNGFFTISGDYTCTQGQEIYMVATGGNPGLTAGTNNTAIALMAGLGTCPASGSLASALPFVVINEVTTVATVWALQQFMAAPTGTAASGYTAQGGGTSGVGVNIGAPSGPAGGYGGSGIQTAVVGLQNGFLMENNLANIAIGLSTAPPIVNFSGGGETTNAVAVAIVSNTGTITGVTIAQGGAGYTSNPTVTISGNPGSCTSVTATETSGVVTSVTATGCTGYVQQGASDATPEFGKIDYIANILSDCINSASNTSTGCSSLFTDATPSVGTAPADTIQAAYSMARNPFNNVSSLNGLETAQPAFSPIATPADYTIAVGIAPNYTYNSVVYPAINAGYTLTVDGYGDIWVGNTNMPITPPSGTLAGSVVELGPDGSLLMNPVTSYSGITSGITVSSPSSTTTTFPTSGMNSFESIAVDASNNVWVPNSREVTSATSPTTVASVAEFAASSRSSSTNANVASTGVSDAYWTPTNPYGVSIDASGNVYSSNSSNKVYEFQNGSGTTTSSSVNASSWTQGTAIDTRGNLWIVAEHACEYNSIYGGALYQFATGTTPVESQIYTSTTPAGVAYATQCVGPTGVTNPVTPTKEFAADTNDPLGIAVDKNNNLWIAEASTGTGGGVTFIGVNSDSSISSASSNSITVTGNGIGTPSAVAIDGNNVAWICNNTGNDLAGFTANISTSGTSPVVTTVSSLSPVSGTTGYYHDINGAKISSPKAIAVDPSGNVWLTNNGTASYITAIVGVAAPTITPLSTALKAGAIGTLP